MIERLRVRVPAERRENFSFAEVRGRVYYKKRTGVWESVEFKPLASKHYGSAPIQLEISGKQQLVS